jgi:hypothetical protein
MKKLGIGTIGAKGGAFKQQSVGYASIYSSGEKILSVDNYIGGGSAYQQRKEPIICIFGNPIDDECLFEGTHEQLVELLKKHKKMLNPLVV